MIIDPRKPEAIAHIAAHLKSGELVAIPTETVYGLAADAANPAAVEKIFHLKKRPFDHPLIVHIAELSQLSFWARDIQESAYQLAKAFWPGPLTLILPKRAHVHAMVTAGQNTVGLRIPRHPVALAILRAFGGGLVAPSANPFMALSPTTATHVAQSFPSDLWVVEGGASEVGLESTIIDCSGERPVILRAGMITSQLIKRKTGLDISVAEQTETKHAGQHKIHYAPSTCLKLFSADQLNQALIKGLPKKPLGLLAYQASMAPHLFKKSICLGDEVNGYAQKFYAALHELDCAKCDEIWVELPPKTEEWQAIHLRLMKAAAKFEGTIKNNEQNKSLNENN